MAAKMVANVNYNRKSVSNRLKVVRGLTNNHYELIKVHSGPSYGYNEPNKVQRGPLMTTLYQQSPERSYLWPLCTKQRP